MNNLAKKLVSFAIAATMVVPQVTAFADGTQYLDKIMFNDVITNELPDNVAVDGSFSARVVNDGSNNKAFFAETGNKSNTVRISFAETVTADRYVLSFDMKFDKAAASAEIGVTNGSKFIKLLDVNEQGRLYTTDKKYVGGVGKGAYTRISFVVDNLYKTYSVLINGKMAADRWKLTSPLASLGQLALNIDQSTDKGAGVFVDNVLVYEGNRYNGDLPSCRYNKEETEYIPIDETVEEVYDTVYMNNNFNSGKASGMALTPKDNTVEVKMTGESEGYLSFVHNGDQDMYADANFGTQVNDVVFEMDVADMTGSAAASLFYLRDNITAGSQVNYSSVNMNNSAITYPGGAYAVKRKAWNTVSVVFHAKKNMIDVYINGEQVAKDRAINNPDLKVISVWRIYSAGSPANSELAVDNMKIYAGKEPRAIDGSGEVKEKTIFESMNATPTLTGKNALAPYVNRMWIKAQFADVDVPCINTDGESLVSQTVFERMTGKKVTVSGDTATVGKSVFTIGSKTANIEGKTVELLLAPRRSGDVFMLPLCAYAKNALGEGKFLDDDHGLYLIGNDVVKLNSGQTKPMNLMLNFERKDGDTLKAEMTEHMKGDLTMHPRLMATADDFALLREQVKNDPIKANWLKDILSQADTWVERPLTKYRLENSRYPGSEVESAGWYLGMAWQLTRDEKYAIRLRDELLNVTSFETWHPQHTLDSSTASMGVAIGFDWVYDYLTDDERKAIAEGSRRLGLEPNWEVYTGTADSDMATFWATSETNWTFIVNGSCAMLAMATAEYDTDWKMKFISTALRSMEFSWYRIAPDGAWYEGPGYWNYFIMHFAPFCASFESCFGYVPSKGYKGMENLSVYQANFLGPDMLSNAFHDGGKSYVQSYAQTYFAHLYDRRDLMTYRIDQMISQKVAANPMDIIYGDTSVLSGGSALSLPLDAYFGETEFISMREAFNDPGALWVSTHGGASNAAHDHLDPMTYVFNVGGVRWADDIGQEPITYAMDANSLLKYTGGYNGYWFYRRTAEGHNMVVINPGKDTMPINQNNFIHISRPVSGENGAYITADMEPAYEDFVSSYTRGEMIDDGRRSFTVRDEIELLKPSDCWWFMQTENGTVEIVDNNTARIYKDGRVLRMQFVVEGDTSHTLTVTDAKKLPESDQGFKETSNASWQRVALNFKADKNVSVTVKMALEDEYAAQSGVKTTPIAEWNENMFSPKAQRVERGSARLATITVNGTEIVGFNPYVYNYSAALDVNGVAPTVGAIAADGARTEISTVDRANGGKIAIIRVYDVNGGLTAYTVTSKPMVDGALSKYTQYKAVATSASSEQVETGINNVHANSADNDMATRWSANGKGEWLIHDFGESVDIDAIAVAEWMGGQRKFYFEIQVSDDGQNWASLGEFATSGESEDLEVFELKTPARGRYMKYVGGGNSTNEWNNVIELCALKKK